MCSNWIEIKNGKVKRIKGKFRKGQWSICIDGCGIHHYTIKKGKFTWEKIDMKERGK